MEHQLTMQPTQKGQSKQPASSASLQQTSRLDAAMHPVLRLQRAVGNQTVQRMVKSGQLDRQTQQAAPNVESISTTPSGVHDVLKSPGQPLPPYTRSFMESRFGEDFSQVRVHSDAQASESAHQVNARAYTVGKDVVFGVDQFAPETSEGRRLIAHELTHVVQQQGNGTDTSGMKKLRIGVPGDAFERQADVVANRVTDGDSAAPETISATSTPTLQRVSADDISADDIWEGTKNVASTVGGTIVSVGEEAWEGTKNVVSTVEGAITSVGEEAWEGTKSVVSTVEGAVTSVGEEAWKGAQSVASTAGGGSLALDIVSQWYNNPQNKQFIHDLIASAEESPQHVGEFFEDELWEAIKEHWGQIVLVTGALLGAEGIIAGLTSAPEPTMLTKVIAVILQIVVIAILGYFASVESVGAYDEGRNWLAIARRANGDPAVITEASRSFVRMVWHIVMAVFTLAGVRAKVRGFAVPKGPDSNVPPGSVGAMRRYEYEPSPKHGATQRGDIAPAPINGQEALDSSVQVKPTSARRVGIDYETGDFVVFDETYPGKGVFHGHVRSWEQLTPEMQQALIKSGMASRQGRILIGGE